jgi:hypothetical protein
MWSVRCLQGGVSYQPSFTARASGLGECAVTAHRQAMAWEVTAHSAENKLSTDWVVARRERPRRPQSELMRPTVIPQALNGQPFRTADARALGVSLKTLQGARFRRITKGVYVAAAAAESHRIRARGVMLALPRGTIATGVTGLQLHGVDVGTQLPMILATTHPRQVRRRDLKVMRLKQLPPHRDGIASPEHCWLAAASSMNLLDLVTAGDWLLRLRRSTLVRLRAVVRTYSGRGVIPARAAVELVRERVDSRRETWLRLCLVLAGLPDAGVQSDHRR